MKRIIFALALAFAGLSLPKTLSAQSQQNLWLNGGFEEGLDQYYTTHPKYWNVSGPLFGLKYSVLSTDNPHSGTHCIELYPGGGYITIFDDDWDLARKFPAKEGDVFILTYWYRGTHSKPTLRPHFRLYNSGDLYDPLSETIQTSSMVTTKGEWQMHTVKFTVSKADIPANKQSKSIDFADFLFYVPQYTGSGTAGSIFLDDVSLVRGSAKPQVVVPVPSEVQGTAFERELELSWGASADKDVSWEVLVGGQTYKTTKPDYILTELSPNTSYEVKIRAVKGENKSEYKTLNLKTKAVNKDANDDTRLPYLRTISPDGAVKKTLNLFYLDLHKSASTQFTYWVDGTAVQPSGHQLSFPTTGKHVLKVRVNEGGDKVWTLVYKVNVSE